MDVHADRRRRALEAIEGTMVVFAAPVAIRNNDVEHDFRQDSDLHYLTGFTEPESVLVLSTTHPEHRAVLFVRPRDPERETWDGRRAGVEGAVRDFGVDAAFPIEELAQRLPEYLTRAPRLYHRLGRDRAQDDRVLDALARVRGRGRTPHAWPTSIVDSATVLHEMRYLKDDREIAAMRRAAEITAAAHVGVMQLAAPGKWEYELEAHLTSEFRRSGSERTAYSPIVGSGPNATILHYRDNGRQMVDGDLVLVDAGCEYAYYASDVTRTFPASGTFRPAQRRVYEIVLEAQLAAIEATRPGKTLDDIHDVTVSVLVKGLLAEGLLQGSAEHVIKEQSYRRFYMHRTSHWIGMDVHDVGAYYVDGKPRPLEPGVVLTIEPGIYIRADDDSVPEDYRGIGVRIEDDLLVTADGCVDLSAGVPKAALEVERTCRG